MGNYSGTFRRENCRRHDMVLRRSVDQQAVGPHGPPLLHRPVSQHCIQRLFLTDENISYSCQSLHWLSEHTLPQTPPLSSTADTVRLGEHDYNDDNDGADHQDIKVAETVYFPDFTSPEAYHDLALLKLTSTVNTQVGNKFLNTYV